MGLHPGGQTVPSQHSLAVIRIVRIPDEVDLLVLVCISTVVLHAHDL